MSGISEIMHYGIPINMPYSADEKVDILHNTVNSTRERQCPASTHSLRETGTDITTNMQTSLRLRDT